MKILITAPHSLCLSVEERTCDLNADMAAQMFHEMLPDSYLFLSDRIRAQVDYNRIKYRDTQWRRELRKHFSDADILLDIHSFPPEGKLSHHEVYALVLDKDGKKLAEMLGVPHYYGTTDNDILVESPVPSILLEFREDLSEERLREIVQSMVQKLDPQIDTNTGRERINIIVIILMAIIIILLILFLWLVFWKFLNYTFGE